MEKFKLLQKKIKNNIRKNKKKKNKYANSKILLLIAGIRIAIITIWRPLTAALPHFINNQKKWEGQRLVTMTSSVTISPVASNTLLLMGNLPLLVFTTPQESLKLNRYNQEQV